MTKELKKRKWCYIQPPKTYEMPGCSCGNLDTEWSEYEGMLWCAKCNKDFKPEHNGLFDGPIGIQLCAMMGIHFNRYNIETGKVEYLHLEDSGIVYKDVPPQ